MNNGILRFHKDILRFEGQNNWKMATETAYHQWIEKPDTINSLICAGTEIWYGLLIEDYYLFAPSRPADLVLGETDELQRKLWEITSYGEHQFKGDANFNAYFGYMYKVMPYFFLGYAGNYSDWQTQGCNMMRKSAELDTSNLFATAMAHEMDDNSADYQRACRDFWSQIGPQQWGASAVQRYFFYILDGNRFYPDAYAKFN